MKTTQKWKKIKSEWHMSPRTWIYRKIESTDIPKCVNLNWKLSGGNSSDVIVDKNSNATAEKWKYPIPLCFGFRLKLDMSSWTSWEMKVSYSDCDWSFFISKEWKSECVKCGRNSSDVLYEKNTWNSWRQK